MSVMVRVLAMVVMLAPAWSSARAETPLCVAVLPFEVFSLAPVKTEGPEVARSLMELVSQSPLVRAAAQSVLDSAAREGGKGPMLESRIRDIARLTQADYVVFGSVTHIGSEISMDVQVFNTAPDGAHRTVFSEGGELAAVIEDAARKVVGAIEEQAALRAPAHSSAVTPPPAAEPAPEASAPTTAAAAAPPDEGSEADAPAELPVATGSREPAAPVEEEALQDAPPPDPGPEPSATASDSVARTRPRTASSQSEAGKVFSFEQPVNIHSDSLVYDNKNNTATFSGSVVARQGDIVIYADMIKGEYSQAGGLNRLTASGNVKVVQADRIATGTTVIFYNDEQKIVATGNPRVWQGDNVVQGTRITVFLKDDRYVIEGSPADRVTATIFPEKKE